MPAKFAILLDGGFVVARFRERLGRHPTSADVVQKCRALANEPVLERLTLLRTYWYDAPPTRDRVRNPVNNAAFDLGTTTRYSESKALQAELELSPDFALRLGELMFRGWRVRARAIHSLKREGRAIEPGDLIPNLEQKGVDLRIGLDIARLSLRALVDTIVVVSGDSDLIPAFKFARREGLRVVLDHLGAPVRRELKAHADLVLAA